MPAVDKQGVSLRDPGETDRGYLEIRPPKFLSHAIIEQAYRENDARDRLRHEASQVDPEKLAEHEAWFDAIGVDDSTWLGRTIRHSQETWGALRSLSSRKD